MRPLWQRRPTLGISSQFYVSCRAIPDDVLVLLAGRANTKAALKSLGHRQRRGDDLNLLAPFEPEPLLHAVVTVCAARAIGQEITNFLW